jgi:hypothetical protein
MNRNEINIDEVLNEPYVVRDGAFDGKWTKTTQFLNPLIDLNLRNRIIMNYFVNMFLDDHAVEHNYVRPIFVLFRTKGFPRCYVVKSIWSNEGFCSLSV